MLYIQSKIFDIFFHVYKSRETDKPSFTQSRLSYALYKMFNTNPAPKKVETFAKVPI